MKKALACIDRREAEMLRFWKNLVQTESPSDCKAGVDAVGQAIAAFCEKELGWYIRFQEDPVYGNCLAVCSCPWALAKVPETL